MRMRAAFVSNASTIGGGERCLEDLFRGMGARMAPLVFCPGDGAFPRLLRGMQIDVETRALRPPTARTAVGFVADSLWLRRRLNRHHAAVVHANSPVSLRPVALATRATRVPLICHVHYPLGEDFLRWAFRVVPSPDAFILVCHDLQRSMGSLLEEYCPGSRQYVVYNGIDVEAFAPAPIPDGPARHVGIVANLQPVKGHEDFLQMAAILAARHPSLRFHIVGDDVQALGRRPKVEALVRELRLDDKVRFWGFVDDVREAYRAFEILVCASHEEAAPRCLVEAMAMGRPIIATRVNGIPDMIDDGVNGLLVPPGEPAALASAVERLLTEPGLASALIANGRRRAVDRYSVAAYADNVARVYAECGVTGL